MSGEPRCDDCGSSLGELHPDRTGDLLCRRCFVKRYPAEVVDAEEPSVAVLANGNGPASASDLHARLEAARRDIVPGHGEVVPDRPAVPASEGLIPRGARVLCAASAKTGKTIAWLVHSVDVVAAGGSVALLDRENGEEEYRRRLGAILDARGASVAQRVALRERLRYYAWPELRVTDRGEMVAALDGCDLVVFDSSRAHTSALGLAEDKSDDYARFSLALIDPLARAGIATLILDNTGWEASDRPRGSTSKIDLCDVVLLLECPLEFGLQRRGRLRLTRKLSRLAEIGEAWDMELGAGAYGAWTATGADARRARAAHEAREAFRVACVAALEDDAPLGRDALLKAARGCGAKGKSDTLRTWLTDLSSDPTSGVGYSPDGYRLTGVDPLTPAQGVRVGSGPPGTLTPAPPSGT